ncbi:MAG TPA: hypothetical protein VHM31_13070 [Polyangia bacterium]|nr:hypothetical protein [Polyangia bacterium]
MNNQYEPMRLADNPDAPADLRRLLARAHDDVPSLAQRELLVKAALGQAAAPPKAWGHVSGAGWATRAAQVAVKTLSVAAVVGVGAGAVYTAAVRWRPARPPADPIAAPAVAEVAPAVADPQPEDAPGLEPAAGTAAAPTGAGPRRELHVAPAARAWMRSHGSREARAGSGIGGAGTSGPATSVAAPTRATASVAAPAVERRRVEDDARTSAATPAPAAAEPEARAEPEAPRRAMLTPGEAGLLRSAREALATSPARTLSLTNEHLRRYPHGMLNQEREALAIEALLALGSVKEARQRAWAFELEYPDSPHRARIRQALARASGDAPSP